MFRTSAAILGFHGRASSLTFELLVSVAVRNSEQLDCKVAISAWIEASVVDLIQTISSPRGGLFVLARAYCHLTAVTKDR